MPGFASPEIQLMANTWVENTPGARFGGIVSYQEPRYGYHHGRIYLPSDDDSVWLPEDKQGDPAASCAIDVLNTAEQMRIQTKRLLDSALDMDDPRLNGVRHFAGTLDNRNVTAYDCHFLKYSSGFDDSHLSHIHFEIKRAHYNNWPLMQNFLSVILGATMSDVTTRAILAGMKMLLGNWAPSKAEWVSKGGTAEDYDALNVDVVHGFTPDHKQIKLLSETNNALLRSVIDKLGGTGPITISDSQLDKLAELVAVKLGTNIATMVSNELHKRLES